MKLSNLIKICLLHTVLICSDALSIEKCKTPDCLKNLSTKILNYDVDLNVQPNIANEHQLNEKSNEKLNEKSNESSQIKIKRNDDTNGLDELNKKSKRISNAHLKELIKPKSELKVHSEIKSKIVSTTPSNLQSSILQLNQPSSQQKSTIQINNENLKQLSNSESTHQLLKQNNSSNELRNNVLHNLDGEQNKKSTRTKREPRGRIGGGKASTSGTKRTKQDGTEVDDDSGSMKIKPFLCLVILSILFLFI